MLIKKYFVKNLFIILLFVVSAQRNLAHSQELGRRPPPMNPQVYFSALIMATTDEIYHKALQVKGKYGCTKTDFVFNDLLRMEPFIAYGDSIEAAQVGFGIICIRRFCDGFGGYLSRGSNPILADREGYFNELRALGKSEAFIEQTWQAIQDGELEKRQIQKYDCSKDNYLNQVAQIAYPMCMIGSICGEVESEEKLSRDQAQSNLMPLGDREDFGR